MQMYDVVMFFFCVEDVFVWVGGYFFGVLQFFVQYCQFVGFWVVVENLFVQVVIFGGVQVVVVVGDVFYLDVVEQWLGLLGMLLEYW